MMGLRSATSIHSSTATFTNVVLSLSPPFVLILISYYPHRRSIALRLFCSTSTHTAPKIMIKLSVNNNNMTGHVHPSLTTRN